MKLLSTSLLVFSLSIGTFGARILERSNFSAKDKCPSAKEVTSSTFTVNGHEDVRQTFTCPDGSLAKGSPSAGNGKTIRSSALEKRNAAECRTPAPECQCGTSFVCECQNVTASAPNPNDCTILEDSTGVISQTEGPTFIVQPDNFELITFQGSTGGLVNQVCFEEASGTAAACNANDDLWLVQALRVGS